MPLIDSSDAEIEIFDEVCSRLAGFDERIGTEWADGYLTALVAGPLAPALDEILPRLAGDAFARAFADPEDEGRARQALQARLRVLAHHLDPQALLDDPEALRLQPLVLTLGDEERRALVQEQGFGEDEADHVETLAFRVGRALPKVGKVPAPPLPVTTASPREDWAFGFADALEDFDERLQAPADADEDALAQYGDLLDQITVLMLTPDSPELQAHAEKYWKGSLPTRDDLVDAACLAVQDLRLWWLDHAPRPATRRVAPAPGRNDPCPCGSGRKFKKCHGKAS